MNFQVILIVFTYIVDLWIDLRYFQGLKLIERVWNEIFITFKDYAETVAKGFVNSYVPLAEGYGCWWKFKFFKIS